MKTPCAEDHIPGPPFEQHKFTWKLSVSKRKSKAREKLSIKNDTRNGYLSTLKILKSFGFVEATLHFSKVIITISKAQKTVRNSSTFSQ